MIFSILRYDGGDALREHIRWILPKYLYNDGRKAGVITRREFARYRHRLSKKNQQKVKVFKAGNTRTLYPTVFQTMF